MPMIHESRRGVNSREDREDGMVDAVLYVRSPFATRWYSAELNPG